VHRSASPHAEPVRRKRPGYPTNGKEWGQLAFVRFIQRPLGFTLQLAVVNADGTNLRFLTDTLWEIEGADFSPDGTKIVFVGGAHLTRPDSTLPPRSFGLWVINADGSGLTPIDSPSLPNLPRWTPDGRQLVFEATLDDNIWIENSDGTSQRQLTSTADTDIYPVMSPDGRLIAFSRSNGGQSQWAVFVMNADGTNVRPLTSYAGFNDAANWSADGKQLVFGHSGNDGTYLAVVNADGTGFGPYSPSVTDGILSALRPDGNAVAYLSQSTGGRVVMDRATGKGTTVTSGGGYYDGSPSWGRTK
jgi:Tol biopolymer transport system component